MKRTTLPRRIGRALARRRKALKINQDAFAAQVNMHRVYYSAIERGLKKIRIDTLERLCVAANARPWEILKEADE